MSIALRSHPLIGLDTSVFIYLLADHPQFADVAELILNELRFDHRRGVTSVITLTELIVRPLALGRVADADTYISALRHFPNLEIAEATQSIALRAAALRATYRMATPDALQIATCLERGATAFVTNDRRLSRVEELRVIVLDEFT